MTTRLRIALAAVLILTALTYRGALHNGFVWDDTYTIVHNRAIDSLGSAAAWFLNPESWSSRSEVSYRPVITASFGLDVALFGRNPFWFHAVNIGLHLAVIALVAGLAFRIWRDARSALAAAAVVAWHPLNAEAVVYVSARSTLLSTLLVLAAITAWDRANRTATRGSWMIMSWVLGALALGAKEAAVILPLLIVAWDRLTSQPARAWAESIRASASWWVLVAAYLAWRTWLLSDKFREQPIGDGAWQPALFAIKMFLVSVTSWLVPIGSAIDHGWSWRIEPAEGAALIAGAAVAAALTVAVFRFDRRVGWCVAWFWISLLPLAALPWVSRVTLYQDQRVYLAGVGLACAAGELARRIGVWCAPRRMLVVLAGLAAVATAAGALWTDRSRTMIWRDADRLWAYTLSVYPTSILARNHLALRLVETGDLAAAREHLETSAAFAPNFPATHNYLGIVYARLGELDLAIVEFNTAVRLSPFFGTARLNLGNAYEKAGRQDLALAAYETDVPDQPWAVQLLERSATLLTRMGRYEDARLRWARILRIDPHYQGQ
ncbi:MAG: tetratricopeptide repeat protein [Nitrospirota bacterium]